MAASGQTRTGRGGAGNIQPSALSTTSTLGNKPVSILTPISDESQRKASGRGGAGNHLSTAPEAHNGNLPNSSPPIPSAGLTMRPVVRGGRGGAGNWGAPAGDSDENMAKVTELDKQVEEIVDAKLTMPARTYQSLAREPEPDPVA